MTSLWAASRVVPFILGHGFFVSPDVPEVTGAEVVVVNVVVAVEGLLEDGVSRGNCLYF